jgi:hypothetical protein
MPAEIALAPSIAQFYPDIFTVEGPPLLKVYGERFFGWYVPSASNLNVSNQSFNIFFGIVPILDLIAGIWNMNSWG